MKKKILGVEIFGRQVRLVAIKHDDENNIVNYTGTYKPIELKDDENAANVLAFKNALYASFDSFDPDHIVIKYRNPNGKGNNAPSPISFKIEGIIQLYNQATITFVHPNTLTAHYKKNSLDIPVDFNYQTEAIKAAYHFIKTN